jgi:aminoglycoside phosphotransferase (APT) family kinase protein
MVMHLNLMGLTTGPASPEQRLPGGVASDVFIVRGPDGAVVVKRALNKLKVAADWRSDPSRSAVEVAALQTAAELIGRQYIPRVLAVDPESNSFTMTLVDTRLRNWKTDLLAGTLDLRTAQRVGWMLARWHAVSAGRPDLAARFADLSYFDELRLEPFFRRVAGRIPSVAPAIAAIMSDMARRRCALVHGDFSPKNVLADGADVVLLDFEVTHWGDPRFDIAFLMTHLLLKSMRRGADRCGFVQLGRAFLDTYCSEGLPILDASAVQLIGCLLLARIEGASPVDYLNDLDVNAVRNFAQQLILEPVEQPQLLFAIQERG